ncbi:MAG: FecR domain-containing protein [Candidatus Sericytochromatia bacterium]|nr:FecR domain-containing protein [Candidatus Sericytochromatia bacterium]
MRKWAVGSLAIGLVWATMPVAESAGGRSGTVARVTKGVSIRHHGQATWQRAVGGMLLATGDGLRTPVGGAAEVSYGDGTITRLGSNTTVFLNDARGRGLSLFLGRLWMKVAKGAGGMQIQTPAAVAAVTGTDLFVFHEGQGNGVDPVSTIGLLEGGVHVRKAKNSLESLVPLIRLATLDWHGFNLVQDLAGVDLGIGQKAVCDPALPTLQVLVMSPAEIAANVAVVVGISVVGPGQPGSPDTEDKPADDGKSSSRPGAATGRNEPTKPQAVGDADGGGGPPAVFQPTNADDHQPDTMDQPVPAVPPALPEAPVAPTPAQQMQDQLVSPVDKSPTAGDLRVIIY